MTMRNPDHSVIGVPLKAVAISIPHHRKRVILHSPLERGNFMEESLGSR